MRALLGLALVAALAVLVYTAYRLGVDARLEVYCTGGAHEVRNGGMVVGCQR